LLINNCSATVLGVLLTLLTKRKQKSPFSRSSSNNLIFSGRQR